MVGALSACGSDGSKGKAEMRAQIAKQKQAAKARRARAATARRQRAIARQVATQTATARRQAITAALIRQHHATQRQAVLAASIASPANDLAAIQRTFRELNAAFGDGVGTGIGASVKVNYWVSTGVYSGRQCTTFSRNRGEGVVTSAFFVGRRTLRPTPGWVDPAVGQVPKGRIYSLTVVDYQTQIRSGARRRTTLTIHVTVRAGRAQLFFRCV
jgi:hypothetical protein